MADDDDEGSFGGAYEDGHWVWDDITNILIFMSDSPPEQIETIAVSVKIPTTVEFRDIDLIEQIFVIVHYNKIDTYFRNIEMRFRKRYQRKVKQGELDVITIQDVKDLVLYTAPTSLLSPTLINFLHLPTTERFMRALVLYCQYYLQTAEEMERRMLEGEKKVRTPICDVLENTFRQNLCDLRSLVAKEYCTILIGGDDTKKFHHMGPQKKRRSLSDKDTRLFETMLRICIQIVWIALGRRSFNYLELEINRIFKSEIFNTVEHSLHTGYLTKMTPSERSVLLGYCVRHDQKLNTRSPLANEVFCQRRIDYRMMGLGVIQYESLPPRLRYLLLALAAPEEELEALGVTLGIIGLPRAYFDTTLHVLPTVVTTPKKSMTSMSSHSSKLDAMSSTAAGSNKSVQSVKKGDKAHEKTYVYSDIYLPPKETDEPPFPPSFPEIPAQARPCSERQCKLWQIRLFRLLNPARCRSRKSLYVAQ